MIQLIQIFVSLTVLTAGPTEGKTKALRLHAELQAGHSKVQDQRDNTHLDRRESIFPGWVTQTSYSVGKTHPSIQTPGRKPAMAQPSSSRSLAERSSSLLQQTARSKSLAEQSARLLQETARIFPNKPYSPGVTKVLETVPTRKSSDGTEKPREPGIKLQTTEEGGSRTEPGRRNQKNPA